MDALRALTPRTRQRHSNHTRPPVLVQLNGVTLLDPAGRPLVQNLSWCIRAGQRWALFCDDRPAATALLRCIAGLQQPQQGRVEIHGHVSWPLGQVAGLSPRLSALENSVVLAGIYGDGGHNVQVLEQIRKLVGLETGPWRQPLKQLPALTKTKLRLALSLAFDFDLYVVDPAVIRPLVRASEWSELWQQRLENRCRRRALVTLAVAPLQLDATCRIGLVVKQGCVVTRGSLSMCRDAAQQPVSV